VQHLRRILDLAADDRAALDASNARHRTSEPRRKVLTRIAPPTAGHGSRAQRRRQAVSSG
jgi:hypothetical protein